MENNNDLDIIKGRLGAAQITLAVICASLPPEIRQTAAAELQKMRETATAMLLGSPLTDQALATLDNEMAGYLAQLLQGQSAPNP